MTDKPIVQRPDTQPAPRPDACPIHPGPRRPDPRVLTR